MSDFTLALRHLRKAPVFTAVAVLSLALGIGANTAIFTVVDEFLLRSIPVRNPEELVLFRAVHGTQGRMSRRGEGPGFVDPATGRNSGTPLSLLIFERLRTPQPALTSVFAFAPFSQVHVVLDRVPETTVSAQLVSGGYFAGLGVSALLGRTIEPGDDRLAAPAVAVISYRFWQRRFDGDARAVGSTIFINRVPAIVVGVTPPGFEGAQQAGETADISVPLAQHLRFQPDRAARAEPWYWWLRVMGRLAPGATAAQAKAALEPAFQAAAREGWLAGQAREPGGTMPDDPTLAVDPGAQGENDTRRQFARSLHILTGLVGLVLAATCVNVATLLLVRNGARRRELALRIALGASRMRLVRLLLAESVLLTAVGAAGGIVLAWWSRSLLLALRPFGNTAVVLDLPLDGRVLGFTLAVAALTAVAFGLLPAIRGTRIDLTADVRAGARALGGYARSRLGRALLVVQVALAVVLLVSTGLFARTLIELQGVDAGFNVRSLALFRIDATSAGYTRDESMRLHERIQDRLASVPGVRSATFSRVALLSRTRQNMTFSLPGAPPAAGAPPVVNTNGLAPNFFEAMELPLVLGRSFTDGDHMNAPRVAVVNQLFARTYFGARNPLGRRIAFKAPGFAEQVEIVGVARDARYTELRGPAPATVYLPALQQPDGAANFAVRAGGDPAALLPAIRAAVRDVDPTLPVLNLRTQAEQIDRLHGQERLFARLSGFFGLTALALSCVGLYGLLSQLVLGRTAEIGLRLALGARPAGVRLLVIRESLLLVGAGSSLGLFAAWSGSRLVAAMLYGVRPTEPAVYATAVALLLACALGATLLPAYRASRIEPLEALKAQ